MSMNKPLNILVVEDSEDDTLLLLRELRRGAFAPDWQRVDNPAAMEAALESKHWDLVVADFSMPQFNALAALDLLKSKGADMPFIIVSGTIGEELAVRAMKNGAADYIMKGNLNRLVPAVQRELREAEARRERRRIAHEIQHTREQFRVAREIQQRLFPKAAPRHGPFEMAGASHPAEATGGDYFDYLRMRDGSLCIVVADVAGHGLGPALLMAETRAYLRALASEATDVGDLMSRANRMLADDVDVERFVTMFLVRLDGASSSVVYASAGHPEAYLFGVDGQLKAALKRTGPALGMDGGLPYTTGVAEVSAGDLLFIPTDGFEETLSPQGEPFGTQRLIEVVRSNRLQRADEILRALHTSVVRFADGQPPQDDLTAVVVQVR
jgi:sigma-B regulation protein RsbU (phosphoserine phosphatase)